MRGLLVFFFRCIRFRHRLVRLISRRKGKELHAVRVVSGKAWEDFCDTLKAAGASLMYPGAPRDPFTQAEGLRYLARLTRGGLEAFVEFNDPAFPVFRRMVHETVKMGADNPDNFYFNAQIDGNAYEYRITGKRNTVHYFGLFTQNGNYGTTGGLAPCGQLDHTEIQYEPDGGFNVWLTRERQGKNWLRIEPGTGLVMVRQTFLNRLAEIPAELTIETLNGTGVPSPVNPERIDNGLQTASLFVGGASLLFARWAKKFQEHTNRLPLFDPATSNAAGGDPNILYYHSHWKLAPDQFLVIEAMPPACDSWNFQLNNYWMESLDYRYFIVCINQATAHAESDGSVKVIVAHHDPGHPNWINTCGHSEGTMCWRWYRLKEGERSVEPTCSVITMNERPTRGPSTEREGFTSP